VRVPSPPPLLYGTAWKEDDTEACVTRALAAGFRGIDTANQRKHYFEEAVGRALARAFDGGLARDDVFVQTKFTFQAGQDHRLPYDPAAPTATQVRQSFDSSCVHLGMDVIDSLVLHGPSQREGLVAADEEAWRAMEELAQEGRVRALGVSNVSASQLDRFATLARVPVTFVQNRCYARLQWDREVRTVAAAHGVVYQGFSLLTANRAELKDERVQELARRHDCTIPQLVFAFAREVGMLPLTGTTDETHMREDLASVDLTLDDEARRTLEEISAVGPT
jgi:diketogulonate reductase-like aldo/keto reductase